MRIAIIIQSTRVRGYFYIMATPVPNQVDLSVIQERIDQRRQGGIAPQIEQQTGAAAPPSTGATPPIDQTAALAQRAGGAAPTATAPTAGGEDSPEETKIVIQLLLKKLQTLLKTGPTGAA